MIPFVREVVKTAVIASCTTAVAFAGAGLILRYAIAPHINVTDYNGWAHDCEKAGGVVHDGRCFDPSALINPAQGGRDE